MSSFVAESGQMAALPADVARVVELMSAFPGSWGLCGGWAVDAWLGRITREHSDVDIFVFEDDQLALRELLPGWQLVAHDDNWSGKNPIWPNVPIVASELWDGRRVEVPGHFHARAADEFEFELNLNERDGEDWVFSRELRIALPVSRTLSLCDWGIPAVALEVVAFFKLLPLPFKRGARPAMRPKDEADVIALLPVLDGGQLAWLRQSVAAIEPGHPWLGRLSHSSR